MNRLEHKIAVITGAASGIGAACAKRLADEGAVIVGLDIQEAPNWTDMSQMATDAQFHLLDVTDVNAVNERVAAIIESLGRIDILITAAGVGDGGPVHMVEDAAWDRVIDINLKGTFNIARAVLPPMMEQRSGSIITIASVEGINGTEGGSAYNASKGAVVLLSKNMAIDYGRMGIRCNSICPGFIDTPLLNNVMDLMPDMKADVIRETKIGRLGKPEEIAATAAFLASDDASYLTGQAIIVDGGYTAGHSHGIVEMMGLT